VAVEDDIREIHRQLDDVQLVIDRLTKQVSKNTETSAYLDRLRMDVHEMRQALDRLTAQSKLQAKLAEKLSEDVVENREYLKAVLSRGSVSVGDVVGGNKAGRDMISNEQKVMIAIAAAIVAVASLFVWAMYYLRGNGKLQPPPAPITTDKL